MRVTQAAAGEPFSSLIGETLGGENCCRDHPAGKEPHYGAWRELPLRVRRLLPRDKLLCRSACRRAA